MGLRCHPPRRRGPSGDDPISSARAYIPDPPFSSPHGFQPESAPPAPEKSPAEDSAPSHDSFPRPAEHPPPLYLELGFAGSASAPWNMVALSNSAPPSRSNRAVGRAGYPALPDHWPAWLPFMTSSLSNTARPLEIPPLRPASQREGSLKRPASALILDGFHWLSCPSVSRSGTAVGWGIGKAAGWHLKRRVGRRGYGEELGARLQRCGGDVM